MKTFIIIDKEGRVSTQETTDRMFLLPGVRVFSEYDSQDLDGIESAVRIAKGDCSHLKSISEMVMTPNHCRGSVN